MGPPVGEGAEDAGAGAGGQHAEHVDGVAAQGAQVLPHPRAPLREGPVLLLLLRSCMHALLSACEACSGV